MEDVVVAKSGASLSEFWRGKRVLLTGHTGFKGSWLALWLHKHGAKVTGISLSPATTPNLFELANISKITDNHYCDIRNAVNLADIVDKTQPEIVFHLAAQSLVRVSYREPVDTFMTNVLGTAHLLNALRGLNTARLAIMVTTDKVYRNNEWPWPYREDDVLGGHDPYSASKAASEIIIASYRDSFLNEKGIAIASARAGNVIGGGDWSEDRLLPDAARAWQAGKRLEIRRPQAIRPWQHVLEPLYGYLVLAQRLWHQPELAGAYNFGPKSSDVATVREVVELAKVSFGCGDVKYGDGNEGPHEAGWLTLETAKARLNLGVNPILSLAEAVGRTMAWYRSQNAGADAVELCLADISDYEARFESF